ncbi:hypothetical protein ACVIHI_002673 [Bradyrhizobium sp. USDA 4524]|uniref:hypothetical protein n=1 Tax=unclassified Bradyrhizobium TaxID=2631580 RepID=UPI0020A0BAF6|nr:MULTISPECIES: hypothetical protein [unclassified Bradyrhizobium]MCP1844406.1 hypothetical protein [Bradyrhizobium sp. USDA 4538]MCP1904972.1 hypothetical protein [Bradyrhizobium sp. USDA 4537]MCP1989372.1 hypothetical protein [Bradyrhizobium sp. USDA 4539]
MREVRQRDDGMFDVVVGDVTAGPFPSYGFAVAIAEGREPERRPAVKFRRFTIVREVRIAATA